MAEVIYINGKFLDSPVTGVQRYALELFRQMDGLLGEPGYSNLRIICLVPCYIMNHPDWQRIGIRHVGFSPSNLWEQVDLPVFAHGELIFSPANTGPIFYANQIVTFHDANIFAVPEAYSFLFRAKYKVIFNALARIAKCILTDSKFSQKELALFLRMPSERFKVIRLGGDHLAATVPDASILARNGLTRGSYLLCVASQSRHKNFDAVLKIFNSNDLGFELVVVGGKQEKIFQKISAHPDAPNIRVLGFVSDGELRALYENALGFIFPSLYEGFGLPILEAMNCGCPVICSSAASLPEVGGQSVVYFNPRSQQEMTVAIKQFMVDPGLRDRLKERGYEQAANFSWEMTARETLNEIIRCL